MSNNITVDVGADGAYIWNVYCFDTSDQYDYDSSNFTLDVDTASPQWTNNKTSLVTTYSPSTPSKFNITMTDNFAVSKVLIELIDSGNATNYTMTNTVYGGDIYNYTRVLSANDGNPQYWKVYANDTAGNWNFTGQWDFTIQKASNPTHLYLNGTEDSNKTYTYPQAINATAAQTYPVGSVYLSRDGVNVSDHEEVLLGNGTYAYSVIATGSVDYLDNSTPLTYYAIVDKGTPNVVAYIDGAQDNETITYPASSTIKGDSSTIVNPPTFSLYVGSVSLGSGNPASQSVVMGAGTYNVVYNTSGNDNRNWTAWPVTDVDGLPLDSPGRTLNRPSTS